MAHHRGEIEMEGRPLLQLTGPTMGELKPETDPNSLLGGGFSATVAHRPSFAHTEVHLESAGQQVLANAGSMLWMDSKMRLETGCHNGMCVAWCRTCAKESFCLNTFSGPGDVAFGFDLPGDILPFATTPTEGWIVTSGSFVCGTTNLRISAQFAGCLAACCSGEGAFLTHIRAEEGKGNALFFAGNYGQIQRHEVPQGKTMVVNNGLFFAASDKTNISIGLPGGCKSLLCSGEGIVMRFTGPCVVYTQNRDPITMMKLLNPWQPPSMGGDSDDGAANGVALAIAS